MPKILEEAARSFKFTREAVNPDGTIDVSFSSETDQVERWFGIEILSHAEGAMDMTRASQGLPFLINHDCEDLVGRAENIRIEDKKGRATLRFSSSPEAQQIRQDMLDGIRPDISVGYVRMEETTVRGEGNAPDVVTVTRWMPIEITTASIPADISVGVGRSLSPGARDGEDCANEDCTDPDCANPTCEGECTAERKCERCAESRSTTPGAARSIPTHPASPAGTAKKESPMTPEEIAAAQRAAEDNKRTERVEALQLAGIAQRNGCGQEAQEILGSDKPLAEARTLILALVAKRGGNALPAPMVDPGVTEMREYSLVRAMNAIMNRENCAELEISQELGKKMNRGTDGFFFPTNLAAAKRAGLDSATATKGAELKYTEAGGFIELLRNRCLVLQMGAEFLPGLQGKIGFSRQTGAATLAWLATENPGSDTAESNLTTDLVTIDAKTAIATTSISKQLLLQSAFPAESKVRNDLARIVAIGLDTAAINGSGASGQPKGILNQSGIGSVAMGTNGLAIPSVSALVDLETAVAVQNADFGSLGYLTTPGQRGVMKKTPAFSTAGAAPIWTEGPQGSDMGWVNGYKAGASMNVPGNLTKGTSSGVCHAVIFGNFGELIIGEWGALEILLDPFRLKKQGMIELTATYFCDVAVKHAASFAAIKDAL